MLVATPRLRAAIRARLVLPLVALLVALAVLAAACGSASDTTAGQPRELNVFAASSLTDAFTQLGSDFTAAHPDVKVSFNFAGSNDLVTQLQQGAPADVLATADTSNMDAAGDLVGTPQAFAGNKLMIAVEPGNPQHITGLADLARKDLKVVLAAPEVPAGKYAQEALGKAGVTVKPVSLEVSVKGVVTKISLGEADAGIVYVTDVAAAQGQDRRGRDPRRPERDRELPDRHARPAASTPTTPSPSWTSCCRTPARRSSPTTGSCPRREQGRRATTRARTPARETRRRAWPWSPATRSLRRSGPSRRRGGRRPPRSGARCVPAATGRRSASCRSPRSPSSS